MKGFEQLFGTWEPFLRPYLLKEGFTKIGRSLKFDFNNGTAITPLFDEMFRAFKECPLEDLKVVFLLNNPYCKGEGDGIGLSAGKDRFKVPEVLTKVFDAIEIEIKDGLYLDRNDDLTRLANQGVLLLHCDMSTVKNKVGAHLKLWRPFTSYVIKKISDECPGVVFVLLGKESWRYASLINPDEHSIIRREHPMVAVVEKREWNIEGGLFKQIDRITTLIYDTKINWTDYE